MIGRLAENVRRGKPNRPVHSSFEVLIELNVVGCCPGKNSDPSYGPTSASGIAVFFASPSFTEQG